MIKAELIQSTENFGHKFKTFKVTFPRFILAELNTHKMLSKNSASSRAIPFEKMVKSIQENPFIPIAWQKDHKGMQGNEYLNNEKDIESAKDIWKNSLENAIRDAKALNTGKFIGNTSKEVLFDYGINVTKQLCNRLLEPFAHHTCLISGTEWENFFALRMGRYEISEEDIKKLKSEQ